jgi:TPP-dependent pyruvate/acetoin dehydrogenase alpha subunit
VIEAALAQLLAADAALQAGAPSPLPLPVGDVAPIVVGVVLGLREGDWWVPGPRERAGAVLRGVAVERLADALQGARPYRVAPGDLSPALRALHAVGLTMTHPEAAAVVHLGAGALADGAFPEALGLAALRGARVVFVLAERDLAGAPVPSQSVATGAALAAASGVRTVTVDGRDAAAVQAAVASAVVAEGPTLIVAWLPSRTP